MLKVPTEVFHWTIGCEPGPGKNLPVRALCVTEALVKLLSAEKLKLFQLIERDSAGARPPHAPFVSVH
jgi:hypothetical protein